MKKIILSMSLISSLAYSATDVKKIVEKWVDLKSFTKEEVNQDLSVDKFNFYRLKLSSANQEQIQVDVYSPQSTEQETLNKIGLQYKRLRTLYNPNFTPYSEGVSKKSSCLTAKNIVSKKVNYRGVEVEMLDAPVGKGNVFGECDPSKIVGNGRFFAFYDKKESRVVEVRYFSKSAVELIPSFLRQ